MEHFSFFFAQLNQLLCEDDHSEVSLLFFWLFLWFLLRDFQEIGQNGRPRRLEAPRSISFDETS